MLSDIIRDFKKHTSRQIIEQIQTQPESRREWMLNLFGFSGERSKRHKGYQFWKPGNHAIEVYSSKFIWEKVKYIHNNPVDAELVKHTEDWLYSSARNYAGMENLKLEVVECIEPQWQTYS